MIVLEKIEGATFAAVAVGPSGFQPCDGQPKWSEHDEDDTGNTCGFMEVAATCMVPSLGVPIRRMSVFYRV